MLSPKNTAGPSERRTWPATMARKPVRIPESQPLFRGVLGGGCARPGKANLRLILRAIRAGWPIPDEKRLALVEHLRGVVVSEHDRNSLAAARCLIEGDRANQTPPR